MLKKIPYSDIRSILSRFELSNDAATVISADMQPMQAIELLQSESLYTDLVNFYSHALPLREAIWWACLVLEIRSDDWTVEERQAIADSKNWVHGPSEAGRRLAEQQVESLGHQCASGWLAQAVFWNGSGSLGEAGQPVVLPPEYLYAKAVAGAINIAAVIPEWQQQQIYYRKVSDMALDLARGGSGL